jgi:hypothetical protein
MALATTKPIELRQNFSSTNPSTTEPHPMKMAEE